jgi:fatty-acyl-CoA synthase
MFARVSTVGDVLDRQAASTDTIALVMPGGVRLSYPELGAASDRFAASLLGLGVQPGDRVGILMHNCLDFVLALFATAKIGAISVPINGRFKVTEADYVVGHADLAVLLTGADANGTDYPALISEVLWGGSHSDPAAGTGVPGLSHVVSFAGARPGFLDRAAFDAAGNDIPISAVKERQSRVRVRDVAVMMYTSGTTARPKGCLLTHEALTRTSEMLAITRYGLQPGEALWDPLPLFHCGGIGPMLGTFSQGGTFCHAGHFDAKDAIETIEREGCVALNPAFESFWLPIVEHPDFAAADFSRVRVIQNGVATPERMARFEAAMPWAKQVTSYGSTELSSSLAMGLMADPLETRASTLGPVIEGMEVKIVDPATGEALPNGVAGELLVRGYACFSGYYKDPVQTAEVLDTDGFFHTGDRVTKRDDGYLVFGGRLKDMLKIGGENVAALELEDYLIRLPGVRIAQVVGVADDRYGEVAAAFIEKVEGSAISETDVIRFCVGQIAAFKVPRYVRFVTEWPMSGTKIKKFELRETLALELLAAGITEAPRVERLMHDRKGDN